MPEYITTYRSPFWNDPRVRSTLDTEISRLPPRPEHLKPWMISSLSGHSVQELHKKHGSCLPVLDRDYDISEMRVAGFGAVGTSTCNTLVTSRVRQYWPLIKRYAAQYGVDPALVLGTIQSESGFNPKATSRAGAGGLMQLMPKIFTGNVYDPNYNVRTGVKFISTLLKKYGGNATTAMIAYNWGPGNVDRWLAGKKAVYSGSVAYAKKVQAYRQKFAACGYGKGGKLLPGWLVGLAALGVGYVAWRRLK